MEFYGKYQCVTFEELVGSGIISEPSYHKKVREKIIHRVRIGGGGHRALIDYPSLPSDLKAAYNKVFPNAEKELIKKSMSCTIQSDDAAVKFYRDYQPAISLERQQEYVLIAQVLNEMVRVEKAMKAEHKMRNSYLPKETWSAVRGTCDSLREAYKHTLPENEARLRQKFNAYKREGYSCLINKNMGNQATRKIGGEEARLILKLRRSKRPIYIDVKQALPREAVDDRL